MYKVPNWINIFKQKTDYWEREMFDNAIKEYIDANPDAFKYLTSMKQSFDKGFEIGFKFAEVLKEWQDMR